MKQEHIQRFCCTVCKESVLRFQGNESDGKSGQIKTGNLLCMKCGTCYPIAGHIARFVEPENYAGSFGFQWNIHRKTQLDSYSGLTISHDRVFEVTGWPEQMKGEQILEAGSGAGRFTEVLLSTGAEVNSFDYSDAVEANWKSNGHHSNLNLFQGDIFSIPFEDYSFDKVFCLGVIQHTPDPELAFSSLAAKVRPGGELVIDVYASSILSLLRWKYLLRPITKHIGRERLYHIVEKVVDAILPLATRLRRVGGRVGARLLPIVEYSHLGLPDKLNREWAILDTFDMYSPAHDHPRSLAVVRGWFECAGFERVEVKRGPNGVVGRGVRPL